MTQGPNNETPPAVEACLLSLALGIHGICSRALRKYAIGQSALWDSDLKLEHLHADCYLRQGDGPFKVPLKGPVKGNHLINSLN